MIEDFDGIPASVQDAIDAGMAPVKAFRQAEGRAAHDVAVAADMDEQRLTDIENGAQPSLAEMTSLARVLQVPMIWLDAKMSNANVE